MSDLDLGSLGSYLYVFLQSNGLELPVYAWLYHKHSSWGRAILIASVANAMTHPIVFFGWLGKPMPYLQGILLAEAFAILAETGLHRIAIRDLSLCFRASFIANLVSWQLGPLLTYWLFY